MPFRIETILVASDLSDSVQDVVRSAGSLAALTGAALHVVHAVETTEGEDGVAVESRRKAAERELRAQLDAAMEGVAKISSMRVAPGSASELILRTAEDTGADLIVIGPHREGAGGDRPLGTTADRLVRTSSVPCLIVREAVALPLRRMLVPSDLSDAAEGALDVALVWGAALRVPSRTGERTVVDIVHVVRTLPSGDGPSSPRGELEAAMEHQVQAACDRSGCAAPLDITTELVEEESAPDGILRRAGQTGADLLVMGTHGHSAASREAIGSVSSAIARRAECPVLLVPPAFWMTKQARERLAISAD